MKNLIDGIKAQLETLNERMSKAQEFLKGIEDASLKLVSDKANTLQEVNVLNGAIQAYRAVVNEYENITKAAEQNSSDVLEAKAGEAV